MYTLPRGVMLASLHMLMQRFVCIVRVALSLAAVGRSPVARPAGYIKPKRSLPSIKECFFAVKICCEILRSPSHAWLQADRFGGLGGGVVHETSELVT